MTRVRRLLIPALMAVVTAAGYFRFTAIEEVARVNQGSAVPGATHGDRLQVIEQEFADLVDERRTRLIWSNPERPRVLSLVDDTGPNGPELKQMLRRIRQARPEVRYDLITGIKFTSPSQAIVSFLWSGGFHSGQFVVRKRINRWLISDTWYFL